MTNSASKGPLVRAGGYKDIKATLKGLAVFLPLLWTTTWAVAGIAFLALAALPLVAGCRGTGAAHRKAPLEGAGPQQALVGNWVVDQELTADSLARAAFGPQQSVTISITGGQPVKMTIQTNFTVKPFSQLEYEKAKRVCLEYFRANDRKVRMAFLPDGTGTESALDDSGNRSESQSFKWALEGHKLSVEYPDKRLGADFQTECTNTNLLCRPMYFLRAIMFFKHEGPTVPHPAGR